MLSSSIFNNTKKINFIFKEILRTTEGLAFQIRTLTVIKEVKEMFPVNTNIVLLPRIQKLNLQKKMKAEPVKSGDEEQKKKVCCRQQQYLEVVIGKIFMCNVRGFLQKTQTSAVIVLTWNNTFSPFITCQAFVSCDLSWEEGSYEHL